MSKKPRRVTILRIKAIKATYTSNLTMAQSLSTLKKHLLFKATRRGTREAELVLREHLLPYLETADFDTCIRLNHMLDLDDQALLSQLSENSFALFSQKNKAYPER